MIVDRPAITADTRSRWIYYLLAVLAAIHLATLAENHTEAEDSVRYIMDVTHGKHLFLPNHLLFSAINWLHYRLWTAFGFSDDATTPMQLLSAAASLAAVYLVHRIALRLGATPVLALVAAGWTAFSYGFWVYSVEADTYLMPLPAVLLSVLLLFEIRPTDWAGLSKGGAARLVALGLLSASAALLHEQYLFLIPIVGLTLILIWRASPGRNAASLITTTSLYGAVAGGALVVTYCVIGAAALGHGTILETLSWARGHASHGMWVSFSPTSFAMLLVGFVRVMVGINFLASPGAAGLMAKIFPDKSLLEEHYLATHFIGTTIFWVITAATLVAIAAIGWMTVQLIRTVGAGHVEPMSPRWIYAHFAIIYLTVYVVLILIWEPFNLEFWIATVPILALLIVGRLSHARGAVAAGVALAAGLLVANFFGGIWPYSHATSDYWTNENAGFAAFAHGDDVIVTECVYVCTGNLALATGATVIEAASNDADEYSELSAALSAPGPGRVLVSSWALDPPEAVIDPQSVGSSKVRTLLDGVRGRLVDVGRSGSQVIWQVKPTQPR